MIRFIKFVFFLYIILMSACASKDSGQSVHVQDRLLHGNLQGGQVSPVATDVLTLDTAINQASAYFIGRLRAGSKVALMPFDAPTGRLSDYIFEELWSRLEDSEKFDMVDRRNLQRIDAEIRHQYGSGRVDDSQLASLTNQYGAEILVHGQVVRLGDDYRITIYATDVERALSSQRAYNFRNDSRLAALLTVSLEDEIERAVGAMARSVDRRTVIAMGRISFADTQTVSGFSAWLKNSIIAGAARHQDKFQIATDRESSDFAVASRGLTVQTPVEGSPVQAVVSGNYLQIDAGAEVNLHLISASGNRSILSSARFIVPASEIQSRRLSLIPEQNNARLTQAEFQARQNAVAPYSGGNNRWTFTVTPDVLDGIYYNGDFMTMRIFSERDCYFRIIHIDVNGNTQVIYPVSPRDNNFIRAGETRRIPDNTHFRMGEPYGEEFILVAAYDRPFAANQSNSRSISAGTLNEGVITRSLTVNSDNQTAMTPSATARFSYTVLPRQ